MDRRCVAVVVAVLAASAGCGGLAGDARSPTVTPAPVPTDRPTPAALAPGVTADGVVDPDALAAAHGAALSGSFTLDAEQAIRHRNGTLLARRGVAIRMGSNHSRYHVAVTISGASAIRLLGTPPARAEFWTAGGDRISRALTRGNRTTYSTFSTPVTTTAGIVPTSSYWTAKVAPGGQPREDIYPLFAATKATVRESGPGRYRVESNELVAPAVLARAEDVDSPTNVSLRATIGREGLVYRYRLEYDGRFGGEPVTVVRTVRYRDVGTTVVERPPWYDEAASG